VSIEKSLIQTTPQLNMCLISCLL